jgi:uncharacterized protein (TIGR03663 family)
MKRPAYVSVVVIIILVAGGLRLLHLDWRPMHADEDIQADKFGTLLETGEYQYDPRHYHGPTLNYLTLPSAWLSGIYTYRNLDEFTLRVVPAMLGILLVLMPLVLIKALSFSEVAVCAALTAVSPAMTYYSRYYIHEMLLACFAFGVIVFGYLYISRPRLIWAVAAGMSAGLMLATKETAITTLGAMLAALILAVLFPYKSPQIISSEGIKGECGPAPFALPRQTTLLFQHGMGFLLAVLVVVILFYTSFLKHPAGIEDFLVAYSTYFQRAGYDPFHIHSWYYYLGLLLFFKEGPGPFWSEAFVLFLAAIGGWFVLKARASSAGRDFLLRFLLLYTILLTLAYALIPYKTPWCLIGFLHGMILLAGVGAIGLLNSFSHAKARWIMASILATGTFQLFYQSLLCNFKYYADPCNPYVYAHTGIDVFAIKDQLEKLAAGSSEGYNLQVQVFSAKNLWPLPWYFRHLQRVEWWTEVSDKAPPAPVILATPDMEPALVRRLYELPPPGQRELFLRMFDWYVELRPALEIRGYVAKSLWDQVKNRDGT